MKTYIINDYGISILINFINYVTNVRYDYVTNVRCNYDDGNNRCGSYIYNRKKNIKI